MAIIRLFSRMDTFLIFLGILVVKKKRVIKTEG